MELSRLRHPYRGEDPLTLAVEAVARWLASVSLDVVFRIMDEA